MEISIIFAFLAMFCWGIEDFLAQRSAKKIGDMESLSLIVIIGTVFLSFFAIGQIGNLFTKNNMIMFLVVGIINFIGGLVYFESLKEGKISVIDVLFEFELPITVVFGIFFFHEVITVHQFILIGMIFVGILLIATKSFKHLKIRLEKGIFFAMIAAILFGIINFSSAYTARQTSPIVSIWFTWFIVSIFCIIYLVYNNKHNKLVKDVLNNKSLSIFLALSATLAWVFYYYAVSKEEISIITAITEGYPVIAISLGFLINKEKINKHQIFGLILTVVCAILLGFL